MARVSASIPPGTAPDPPGALPTWPATKTSPAASTTCEKGNWLGSRPGPVGTVFGMAVSSVRGFGRQRSEQSEAPAGGLDGAGRPPGKVLGRVDSGGEALADLRIETLAPAAQQQADDPRQVELGVPVADRGLEPARREAVGV